jgi:hypothetical protein
MSPFAGVMFQDAREKRKFTNSLSPSQIQCFIIILALLLFRRNFMMGAAYFFPTSTSWTSCGMARRPLRTTEQFWCSCPLAGMILSTILLYPFKDLGFWMNSNSCPDSRDFKFLIPCSPLSTGALHGRSQSVTIPDAVEIQFWPPEDEHIIARNMSRYLM